ncbi:MAG: alpha/beta hydrolase, partial [Microbacteriaceae bacterium]|nr:alpha/beta hydrolase [Microbacteriaceae bacterium]
MVAPHEAAIGEPSDPDLDEAVKLDAALPDIDWTDLPPGVESTTFMAPSGPLAMLCIGNPTDPHILLAPGVTGSKEDFILMMPGLAAAGFFVQAYDLAGQYESGPAGPENLAVPRRHYDYDLFADDMVAILQAGRGRTHVLGYSFAGTVAQVAFAKRPDLFASLTFLSCPPQPGQGFRGVSRIGWISGLASGKVGAALMIWGLHRNVTHVPPGRQRFVEHRFDHTRVAAVEDIIGLMKRAPDELALL